MELPLFFWIGIRAVEDQAHSGGTSGATGSSRATDQEQRNQSMERNEQSNRLIKFRVRQDQHDLIRLAGALQRSSMAAFARLVVMKEAERVTSEMSPKKARRGATKVSVKTKPNEPDHA